MSKRADSVATISFWRQPISISVAVAVIVFMVLNLTDAFSTLYLLSLGGEEMNPLMRRLLAYGPFSFFVVKYLMVAVAVIGIAVYYRQYREARWALFYLLLPVYLVMATYQIVLLNIVK